MKSGVIRDFLRLVTVITSFLSPGDVYCSRSVCYLPQGLSVECLNLQAPTFLRPIFLLIPLSAFHSPRYSRRPEPLTVPDFRDCDRSVTSFNSTVFQLASGATLRVWSQAWEDPEGRLNAGFSATFPLLGWSYGR